MALLDEASDTPTWASPSSVVELALSSCTSSTRRCILPQRCRLERGVSRCARVMKRVGPRPLSRATQGPGEQAKASLGRLTKLDTSSTDFGPRRRTASAEPRRPPPPQLLERRAVLLLLRLFRRVRLLRTARLVQACLQRALELVFLRLRGADLVACCKGPRGGSAMRTKTSTVRRATDDRHVDRPPQNALAERTWLPPALSPALPPPPPPASLVPPLLTLRLAAIAAAIISSSLIPFAASPCGAPVGAPDPAPAPSSSAPAPRDGPSPTLLRWRWRWRCLPPLALVVAGSSIMTSSSSSSWSRSCAPSEAGRLPFLGDETDASAAEPAGAKPPA